MSERGPTRRAALAGILGVATVAGCRPFGGAEEEAPKPDEVIRQRVLASKRALMDRYTATIERHPTLRARLAPLLADHQAHVQALNGTTASPSPTTSGTGRSGAPGTPGAAGTPAVPGSRRAALAALAGAERAAAGQGIADVLGASPRLARVLASIGACEAGHAELLGSGS
jgi:hypothetical protein